MKRGKYYSDFKNITAQEWLYRTFKMNFSNAQYQEDRLYFPDISLTLEVIIPESQQEDMIHILFLFSHPDLFEPIMDVFNGYGNTFQEQLESIACHALHFIIPTVLDSLSFVGKKTLSAFVLQQEHIFEIHCGNLYLNGNIKNSKLPDLWKRYQDDITKRLGTKNIYWVRFYAEGDSYQVSINGQELLELTEDLEIYLSSPEFQQIDSLKQIIMLIQIPETRISYPFTRWDIQKYTLEAIHLFETEDYDSVYDKLFSLVQDESLTLELFYLIPELYCGIIFSDIPSTEEFYLYDSDMKLVYPSQLRSYQHIKWAIYEYIEEENPSQEQIMSVIGVSSRSHAMDAALESGSNLEDITMASFAIPISEGYVVR